MKKAILLLLILTFFIQCNSQKKEIKMEPVEDTTFSKIPNQKYFVGNWYVAETTFTQENKKEIQLQTNCEKKSFWKFSENNGALSQSKFTAKGGNCSEFISTQFGRVTLSDNHVEYFVDDVLFSVKVNMISDHKFSIISKDLINGKMVEIERIYEKK